jgi:hypothetical protein
MGEQTSMSRHTLLRIGAAGTAFGAAALALPGSARAEAPESVQIAEIYQLQAAFPPRQDDIGPRLDDVPVG